MDAAKHCTGCDRPLPLTMYGGKDRARGRRLTRCRDCVCTYQRKWYQRNAEAHKERSGRARSLRYARNDDIIRGAKNQPCADCGLRFETELMDFDHVREPKLFVIGSARHSQNPEAVMAEIAKCEVVCAACHRVRTTIRARL